MQTQLIQQQIVCGTSEASAIEAKATLDSAKLALSEYAEGTFIQEMAQQESAVFVAEENKRRAEEYVQYSKRLAGRGYISEAQLDADVFALEKAKKELGVAKTKLEVLTKFTREKMLTQLRAEYSNCGSAASISRENLDAGQVAIGRDDRTDRPVHHHGASRRASRV